MQGPLRWLADPADRCLRRYPLSTLGGLIALSLAADFFLLRGLEAALGAPRQVTTDPAASRPAADAATRPGRPRDEIGAVVAEVPPASVSTDR